MSVRTIPEAAAELRVSSRALKKIVVENGLYIAGSFVLESCRAPALLPQATAQSVNDQRRK